MGTRKLFLLLFLINERHPHILDMESRKRTRINRFDNIGPYNNNNNNNLPNLPPNHPLVPLNKYYESRKAYKRRLRNRNRRAKGNIRGYLVNTRPLTIRSRTRKNGTPGAPRKSVPRIGRRFALMNEEDPSNNNIPSITRAASQVNGTRTMSQNNNNNY